MKEEEAVTLTVSCEQDSTPPVQEWQRSPMMSPSSSVEHLGAGSRVRPGP